MGERKILNCKLFSFQQYIKSNEALIWFLLVITATGAICLASSLLGYVGIMLNNRAVLTFYNLFLWVCFGLIASIGYVAYRKAKWNIQVTMSFVYTWAFIYQDMMMLLTGQVIVSMAL